MATDNLKSLETRIEALERRSRWQRLALFGVPCLALLLGAAMAPPPDVRARTVVADKVVIVDEEGRERGVWQVHNGHPAFQMYHKDHSLILNAGKSPENGIGMMQFFDDKGKQRSYVGGDRAK